ncbi:hypothetical protein SODG_006130 [Sodalis praecaptivus]
MALRRKRKRRHAGIVEFGDLLNMCLQISQMACGVEAEERLGWQCGRGYRCAQRRIVIDQCVEFGGTEPVAK